MVGTELSDVVCSTTNSQTIRARLSLNWRPAFILQLMPAPTYSRRKGARRENSEEIEEARPTQTNGHNDDVSDEDQPRRSRVKKEKKGKQRAVELEQDEGEGDEEEEDEEDRIDVANFPDQPLRNVDAAKLKGIADDWDNMRRQINQRCDIYKDVAAAMAEAEEKDVKDSKVSRRVLPSAI